MSFLVLEEQEGGDGSALGEALEAIEGSFYVDKCDDSIQGTLNLF